MISAALAILETDEQRNELSEIYERNIKTFYSISSSSFSFAFPFGIAINSDLSS